MRMITKLCLVVLHLLLGCSLPWIIHAVDTSADVTLARASDAKNVRRHRTITQSGSGGRNQRALKKKDTVRICHFPPEDPTSFSTIEIDAKQFSLHKNHGDLMGGTCEDLCGLVDTLEKLQAVIQNTAKKSFKGKRIVTVCPGTISVPAAMELSLDYPVEVRCVVARTCLIKGEGRDHGFIRLTKGTLTLNGFVVSTFGDFPFDPQKLAAGLISVFNSKLNVVNCVFESNDMAYGAIYADVSTVSVVGSTFTNNVCLFGCAIDAQYSSVITVTDSVFENNKSGYIAGVMLLISGSSGTIGRSTFIGNEANDYGGVVYSEIYNPLYLKNGCVFQNNRSQNGGVVFGKVTFASDANPLFIGNQASNSCDNIFDSESGSCLP